MPRDTYHELHNANGGWNVKRSGGERSSSNFDS